MHRRGGDRRPIVAIVRIAHQLICRAWSRQAAQAHTGVKSSKILLPELPGQDAAACAREEGPKAAGVPDVRGEGRELPTVYDI